MRDIAGSMAAQIATAERRPDAICVETDEFAIAVIERLLGIGIRTPEDISVIGFDDSALAPIADLTTLHQSPVEMGRRCAHMALELMNGQTPANPHEIMRPTLITRGTTTPRAWRN